MCYLEAVRTTALGIAVALTLAGCVVSESEYGEARAGWQDYSQVVSLLVQ